MTRRLAAALLFATSNTALVAMPAVAQDTGQGVINRAGDVLQDIFTGDVEATPPPLPEPAPGDVLVDDGTLGDVRIEEINPLTGQPIRTAEPGAIDSAPLPAPGEQFQTADPLPAPGERVDPPPVALQQLAPAMQEKIAQGQDDGSKNRFFRGLDNGLRFYASIRDAGGWPQIPDGEVLQPGSNDPRVAVLRQRLSITGDYLGEMNGSPVFDNEMQTAVIAYQNRNGLEPDGAVGPGTLAAMNVPVEKRIEQMEINRTRWSLMPASMGERFVLVNMAGFEVDIIEGETTVFSMRAIVGKDYHKTPMFSDTIRTVEFNPYWNVPESIANAELKPEYISSGTASADAQGYEVVDGDKVYPVSQVNWSQYADTKIPFRIRQRPGPTNALGEMKFMFPNKHNVYLHDTPSRNLFSRTVRAFSHGCVRVAKPHEFAAYLLGPQATPEQPWDAASIKAIVDAKEHMEVKLERPIQVHLAYMTAWQGPQGYMQFRPDIYGRDADLEAELQGTSPVGN
ncbi:L,D-transpeptidase family protein [Rhizobiaceae bacterium]|nr:L,D-transpeptidase family protein [Rhizobiaceae bacterium]